MQRLIEDLLAYSRVGRKARPRLCRLLMRGGGVGNLRVSIQESAQSSSAIPCPLFRQTS